jgi:hypothetical protein
MNRRTSTIQEWLQVNKENLTTCPYQMGDLKITRSSCLRQHRKALEWNYGASADNLFLYICEQHLRICQECDRIPREEAEPSGVQETPQSEWNSPALFKRVEDGRRKTMMWGDQSLEFPLTARSRPDYRGRVRKNNKFNSCAVSSGQPT